MTRKMFSVMTLDMKLVMSELREVDPIKINYLDQTFRMDL